MKREPKLTIGPHSEYTEYNPTRDPRMRDAIERSRRDQPPLIQLGSNVPALPYERLRQHD